MNIQKIVTVCLVFISLQTVRADEGMWLPQLLGSLNESRMKSLGMKISAAEIYNINKGSLKDAVVSFGGFCTGGVISSKGLVLTNHHCGFGAIQNHSTLEKNYIQDGFWAKNTSEEIPNQGLYVTFIFRIEEVTKDALKGVEASMSEAERQSRIDKNLNEVRTNVKKEPTQESFTRAFFEGNQYYLFITETYRDVRLVGAPPSSIGNFGKDTDNWVWPRHTGDFSLFRIYASKDNKPADYSSENIPYTPKQSLNIEMNGVREGDFTFVFGFPGRTTQYLHSAAVEQIRSINDPAKIKIRDYALKTLDGFMRKDEQIKIQYAAKYASIQNNYKKWQGEVMGLTRSQAVAKKINYEEIFQKRVNANPGFKSRYGILLDELKNHYAAFEPYGLAQDYYLEIVNRIELFTIASQLNTLITAYDKEGEKGYQQRLTVVKPLLENLLGNYSDQVDKKLFEGLMEMYVKEQPSKVVSPILQVWLTKSDHSYSALTQKIYQHNMIYQAAGLKMILDKPVTEAVQEIKSLEPVQLFLDLQQTYQVEVQRPSLGIQNQINRLQREYTQAQLEVMSEKKFYPNANGTLRVAYGNVQSYTVKDAVHYEYFTDLDGIIEKYIPGDYEFDVPEKLRQLHANKNYGPYGQNGILPVCFIATNHTTGGNSGSPALDARGNLVGLNFDRAWEGTMSDLNYDASICRNIMVDIRYVLFIVDKYADASHLVEEMNLVNQRKNKKESKVLN